MKSSENLSPILAGVSGEYFVAAELSRRGFICSVTLKNTKGIDILVCNESASRTLGIQVKTNRSDKSEWILNEKCENLNDENVFYVFVNLRSINELPEYFIVQSSFVAKTVKDNHKKWLLGKGRNGQQRNDSSMRKFKDLEKKFLNRWDLLNLE